MGHLLVPVMETSLLMIPNLNGMNNYQLQGPSFNLTDIGVLFFQSAGNYSYFHATGNDVQNIILESSAGNLASLTCNVSQTFFNGDINAVGNIVATGAIQALGSVNLSGVGDVASAINSNKALASSKKSFDISHPTKEGHRLRYICLAILEQMYIIVAS